MSRLAVTVSALYRGRRKHAFQVSYTPSTGVLEVGDNDIPVRFTHLLVESDGAIRLICGDPECRSEHQERPIVGRFSRPLPQHVSPIRLRTFRSSKGLHG